MTPPPHYNSLRLDAVVSADNAKEAATQHPEDPSKSALVCETEGLENPSPDTSAQPIAHSGEGNVLPSDEACASAGQGEPLPSSGEDHVQQTEISAATGCAPLVRDGCFTCRVSSLTDRCRRLCRIEGDPNRIGAGRVGGHSRLCHYPALFSR